MLILERRTKEYSLDYVGAAVELDLEYRCPQPELEREYRLENTHVGCAETLDNGRRMLDAGEFMV